MNKFIGTGNLTKDGEFKSLDGGKSVYSNSLAMRNDFKNKEGEYDSEFINFNAWGTTAEYLNKYAKKGNKVLIEGRITTRSYDAQDGTKRYVTEVIANNVELLTYKKDDTQSETQSDLEVPQNYKTQYEETEEIALSDADLPF